MIGAIILFILFVVVLITLGSFWWIVPFIALCVWLETRPITINIRLDG